MKWYLLIFITATHGSVVGKFGELYSIITGRPAGHTLPEQVLGFASNSVQAGTKNLRDHLYTRRSLNHDILLQHLHSAHNALGGVKDAASNTFVGAGLSGMRDILPVVKNRPPLIMP